MPSFDITAPDGTKYTVTGPPGATEQDALAQVQKAVGANAPAQPGTDKGSIAALAAGGIRDIPVVGPALEGGLSRASAGIRSLRRGTPYSDELKSVQEDVEKTLGQHRLAATVGGLTTGIGTMGAAGDTGRGSRLLGLTQRTLPRMIGAGMASNAALGAADAAARGDNVTKGAVIGALTGAAAPVVGRAVGSALQGARNLIRGPNIGTAVPQNTVRVAGTDVPLSGGQETGDVTTQMMENSALRGGEGQEPQRVAEQFFRGTQAPAVEQARFNIGRTLDQSGRVLADDPYAAADLVQQRVQNAEQTSRTNYHGLYDTALRMPGELHAGALEGIGQRIKGQLSLGNSPVIIDDVTTPVASRMIQDVDNQISRLRIQNRADPFGAPNPDNVVGVNLAGIDQTRKRLVSMAASAAPGSADRRAASRVIGSFDDHIEEAMSGGLFTGSDQALDALRQARAAYSQHRQLFRSQRPGDDAGRAMERIIGRNGGEGATPTEVANYLYGNARVGAPGLSTRLASRMRDVLGADSPEWSALRQGLWARLTQATEGTNQMESQRLATRISEFLKGSGAETAQVMFSPQERQMMESFAALQRQLTPKPGTVNYSNTAPVLRMLMANTMRGIMASLGEMAAGPVGMLAGLAGKRVSDTLFERSAAGRVARSLYRTPQQNAADETFARQMANRSSMLARGITPAISGASANQ